MGEPQPGDKARLMHLRRKDLNGRRVEVLSRAAGKDGAPPRFVVLLLGDAPGPHGVEFSIGPNGGERFKVKAANLCVETGGVQARPVASAPRGPGVAGFPREDVWARAALRLPRPAGTVLCVPGASVEDLWANNLPQEFTHLADGRAPPNMAGPWQVRFFQTEPRKGVMVMGTQSGELQGCVDMKF